MKKTIVVTVALAVLFAFASSCASKSEDDWAYIQQSGKLVIGYTEYEPMNYTDSSGKLVGFDTEFAQDVCAKLGLTPDFVLINWNSKENELNSKSIDCIWNGLTVTADRQRDMSFTESYLRNQQVVVVQSANASQYTDLSSLSDKSLVAEQGSAGEMDIQAALPDANYTPVDTQANALMEVKAGTADAAVIDLTMANSMTGPGTDYADLSVVSGVQMQPEEYAVGFRLNSTAVDRVNAVMTELMNDGTLAALAQKYNLTDLLIAPDSSASASPAVAVSASAS